jgi:hypothetical protein
VISSQTLAIGRPASAGPIAASCSHPRASDGEASRLGRLELVLSMISGPMAAALLLLRQVRLARTPGVAGVTRWTCSDRARDRSATGPLKRGLVADTG